MKDRNRRMNRRHAIRFPTEVHRTRPVLIEQRIIGVLVLAFVLLLGWPLMAAGKYTDSRRYREAEYVESADFGIWMFAFILQIAWVVAIFAAIMTLSSGA